MSLEVSNKTDYQEDSGQGSVNEPEIEKLRLDLQFRSDSKLYEISTTLVPKTSLGSNAKKNTVAA